MAQMSKLNLLKLHTNIRLLKKINQPVYRVTSTFSRPSIFPVIKCEQSAQRFIDRLDENEKALLLSELSRQMINNKVHTPTNTEAKDVNWPMLMNLFLYNCIPFIGFGFLDNALMILAGEYIELKFGVLLGITTMAAAALGNLVSDVFGLFIQGYVEKAVGVFGIQYPVLSILQAEQTRTRIVVVSGRVLGIVIGCLLGMFPLLFFHSKDDKEEKKKNET